MQYMPEPDLGNLSVVLMCTRDRWHCWQFAGLLYYPSTEGFNSLTSGLLVVTGGMSTINTPLE